MTTKDTGSRAPSILPVLLIGAAAFILLFVFLVGLKADTTVVVAANPIGVGTRLTADDLTTKQVRRSDALAGAVKSIDEAVGQVISTQRLPGDQITSEMLGSQAVSAIAAGLAPDHRAVAVKVTRSSGLAGIIRPGDYVTLVGVVQPDTQFATIAAVPGAGSETPAPGAAVATPVGPTPTPGPQAIVPTGPFARVTATGLRILLVPQTFRYEETTTSASSADSGGFIAAQTSLQGQSESVIILDVPATPVTITGIDGTQVQISLPELIALLDSNARVYLVLEPSSNASAEHYPGVAIEQLVNLGVGQ